MIRAIEYIWLDGAVPTQQLRSKTRFVFLPEGVAVSADLLPEWSFDGSSTWQADGGDSDLILVPVRCVVDPIRKDGSVLALCEVRMADGSPHVTNTRAGLRAVLEAGAGEQEPWFGFEQEYTLYQGDRPLGWPDNGYPAPQGPFYCGVGTGQVFGRELVETHAQACLDAGLLLYGTNAEVMPGQWEFQIGYRGIAEENADPLTVADHLWLARWLLLRLAEDMDVVPSFDPKPVKGDWNGAGNHTNFSTKTMRDAESGMAAIQGAIQRLESAHDEHIANYGAGLADRLTGLHETCDINTFKNGVADRGASIRIPRQVAEQGHGYVEDRRPGANCDPYVVCALILKNACGLHVEGLTADDQVLSYTS